MKIGFCWKLPAVKVFPVPGPPWRSMIKPFPFPAIRSSLFPVKLMPWDFPSTEVRTITRALMSSLVLEGSARRSKASLFQVTLETLPTSRRTVCLQLILSVWILLLAVYEASYHQTPNANTLRKLCLARRAILSKRRQLEDRFAVK